MDANGAPQHRTQPRSRQPGFFAQAFRFGLVGAGGAIVDYGSLQVVLASGVPPDLARVLSFAVGSTFVYLINRRWTFPSQRDLREVVSLAIVLALTFGLVGGVNALALRGLPDSSWTITLAWAISQAVATTFNFLAQRSFVFHRRTARAGAEDPAASPR
ncbi:GtrA family protein [Salinifilum ghardaiensis]